MIPDERGPWRLWIKQDTSDPWWLLWSDVTLEFALGAALRNSEPYEAVRLERGDDGDQNEGAEFVADYDEYEQPIERGGPVSVADAR